MKEIQQAKTFSILADEASDTSVKEQLSLVIRFVDEYSNIREEFLGFLYCEDGTSGKTISDFILREMSKLEINVNNCRGQGYDGAGNMLGKNKGAAARILEMNPKALYFHCQSQKLNLCIVGSCKLSMITNMMNQVRCIQEFNDYP